MDAKAVAKHLASMGGNDTVLAHINPQEAALLSRISGGRINPATGLPQFGWLQDFSSEFSIHRGKDLLTDPHKFFTTEGTKGFQRTVGPIALEFIPGVGGALSTASRAWLAHESKNPASANYKAPDSSAGAQAAQGVATAAAGNAVNGSGGGLMSAIGKLFGGGQQQSSQQSQALQQQITQLKQQIQTHYATQGQAGSAAEAEDLAKVDAWLANTQRTEQGQAATNQQQAVQQEASE